MQTSAEPDTSAAYRRELRASIARDLHDGPIRELTTCVVRLEGFRAKSDNSDMQRAISAIEEHARVALRSLRQLMGELRDEPSPDDLTETIRATIDRLRASTDAEIVLVVSPAWPRRAADEKDLHLVFVVQEALNNAIRHSFARQILIELQADHERVEISISDDGKGIEENVRSGSGMIGMRERVELLGGKLTVRRRNPGTQVHVEVPLP